MPKLKKPTEADLSAVFSDQVTTKKYRNQTLVSNIKYPKVANTPKREASKEKFRKAASWATVFLMKPGMKKLYSKGINEKLSNAQTVAVRDYLVAPKIHYISVTDYHGVVGDKIRIKATDNFKVNTVTVKITSAAGTLLEEGAATRYPRKPQMWAYVVTVANSEYEGTVVKAIAKDLPGNETEMEVTWGFLNPTV